MTVRKLCSALAVSTVVVICASAAAGVRLPAVIGDHMVLLAGRDVPIWGWADPGEKVTVTLGDHKAEATADGDGRWSVAFDSLEAGGPFELVADGADHLVVHDVLVGEVWLCSGQSNMEFPLRASYGGTEAAAAADLPQVRIFRVAPRVAGGPRADVIGKWAVCTPEEIGTFSAVGFYFARERLAAGVQAIGLIGSYVGGTPAEAWMSREALESDPDFAPILTRWARQIEQVPAALQRYEADYAAWKTAADEAEHAGRVVPKCPAVPDDPRAHTHRAAGLYNAMIHGLVPYGITGVLWYQGESNAGRAYQYRKLFPAMITQWRRQWGRGDFPFLFVQLANFQARASQPTPSAWAELREAQLMTLSLPKTGMAVTIDIGDAVDIHPKDKRDVGHRLALAAAVIVDGRDIECLGPLYKSMEIEDGAIRLHFTHTTGGLIAKGGRPLTGFSIAGADQKFIWADATIDGDTIVVRSDKVSEPVAVRYAWANNPECNLCNGADLPASPFRTDDWPGVTHDAR